MTFDVGGTLITPTPSVGHIYAEVATAHGVCGLPPDLLNQRFETAWKALGHVADSRSDWLGIVRMTFEGLVAVPDLHAIFDSLYERFTEVSAWHLFSDVIPALAGLRSQGTRLGIISNWDDRLRPLLQRLGLSNRFDVFMVSCEQGFRKPQPEIFRAAAKAFRLEPSQVLHVGDSKEHDLDGAHLAGMNATGIRRGPNGAGPGWITDLTQLIK